MWRTWLDAQDCSEVLGAVVPPHIRELMGISKAQNKSMCFASAVVVQPSA